MAVFVKLNLVTLVSLAAPGCVQWPVPEKGPRTMAHLGTWTLQR